MLSLTTSQRDELLTNYRKDSHPELRFRAHIKNLEELLDRVFTWLEHANPFQIEGSAYPKAETA